MALANWGNTLIGQDDYVNQSVNRARGQFDAGLASSVRQAGRMGINPNSGAFMSMLNNAQYDRTAGVNAAANDAQFKWLNAANDQYNRDRAAGMDQERINNQSNQWWAAFGAERDREKAAYAFQEELYKNNKLPWQTQPNGQQGQNDGRGPRNSLGPGYVRDRYIYNPRKPLSYEGYVRDKYYDLWNQGQESRKGAF